MTSLVYRREGTFFEGVSPDYVKYETINGVKKPLQMPMKHTVVVFSDLPDGSGHQSAAFLKSQISAPNSLGVYSIPAGVEPITITIYRNPDGSATTTSGRLEVIHKQRHPQSGEWVTTTILITAPQGSNDWKTEYFLGDPFQNPTLTPYREITITRTPNLNDITQESTHEITKDRDSSGNLVITSDVSVTYGFYKYGAPVKLSETRHTGTGNDLTSNWTYYTAAADQASFNKPATLRRSDGQWANYTYQGSPVTGILLTKTVSGWLDNAAPAIGTAPDENANRVVIEIEANNETGTFSREERIQGVLVSKTWGERYKDNSGQLIEKSRIEMGSGTLTTIRTGYPNNNAASAAERGCLKSIQNPDGTVELHSYAPDSTGVNRVETVNVGAGSLSGVTDGTRTVSTFTPDDILIKEVVKDIASGVQLSCREAIAIDANGQPSRWAYDNNIEDYSETLNGCCGVDSTRTRDGVSTTYTRDGLKRPKTAISKGVTLTYTYGSKTIGGTVFPTENVTATAGSLTLDQGTTVYDFAGNVIQQITPDLDGDSNPEITTTTRDYTNRITIVTNPIGGTVITSYFADGKNKSTTGTATASSYRAYTTHNEQGGGLVTAQGTTATGLWNKTYENLAGSTLKSTYQDGTSEISLQINTYDNLGRMVSTKDADNVTQLFDYNSKGKAYRSAIDLNQNGMIDDADRITDTYQDVITNSPIGNAIRSRTIVYNLSNNPVAVSTTYRSPDGLITRQETSGVGNSATSTSAGFADRTGGTWTDTSTAPDGTKTTITYQNWLPTTRTHLDTANNVIESSTTGYDALRRPVTQTHSRTGLVTTYYAASGLIASIDNHGRVTSFGYDSMGRRIARTLPDNSITHTSYWPSGREKATWGSQSNPTVKFYSSLGQLEELRTFRITNLALAPDETSTGYDATTWIYNSRRLLIRKQYADTKGTDYTYTAAGRLLTRTWARTVSGAPIISTYGYNTAGELETTNYSDTTPSVIVEHDKLGREHSVTNGLATSIFSYDPATLALATETVSYDINLDGTPELSRIIDRSDDNLGRPTGFQLKKNDTTIENQATYGYSASDGRFATVADAFNTFTYSYLDNSSLVETVTATAGAVHRVTNHWEDTRDVLDWKKNEVGTTNVSMYDYSVNPIGQRVGVTRSSDLTSDYMVAFASATAWGYDSLGQLTSADHSVNNNYDRAYQYDTIGNRIEARNETTTVTGMPNYAANLLNQYSTVPQAPSALSFDFDGNMTRGPLPAAPLANSDLTWDAENRMTSDTVGEATTTYIYDAQSRRIAKTNSSGATTLFVYDGWNCIAEYNLTTDNSTTPPTTAYTLSKANLWGLDLSGSLQGVGGVGGLLSVRSGSDYYYPTYDGNGNVSEYLRPAGSVAAHFEYDTFGNTTVNTDALGLFSYRFSTKPLDAETGLYYYGYRYYDPLTGRWTSRDPIEEEGGLNLYAFVANNGVNYLDFLGNVLSIMNPGLIDGRPCYACCATCEKTGTPKIEDNGTSGTSVKAKITSIDFKSIYITDDLPPNPPDCCAVYYRWWSCYTKRCQQHDGGPNLNITVEPIVGAPAWTALNIKLIEGYFWCACEKGKWKCHDENQMIIMKPTYSLIKDSSGSYYDYDNNWYGWGLPKE